MLQSRQPDLETVLVPVRRLVGGGDPRHHRGHLHADPELRHRRRGALSGEVDMIEPVPVQDAERVDGK
jgi:peptide/nickel transport system substrate-binding protein